MTSDTPRVDEFEKEHEGVSVSGGRGFISPHRYADFARTLERELNEARRLAQLMADELNKRAERAEAKLAAAEAREDGARFLIEQLEAKLAALQVKPDVAGLSFVMEDRGGVMVIDWSKKGGLGCGPADIAHIELYRALLSLSARLQEKEAELKLLDADRNAWRAQKFGAEAECEGLKMDADRWRRFNAIHWEKQSAMVHDDRTLNIQFDEIEANEAAVIAARKP